VLRFEDLQEMFEYSRAGLWIPDFDKLLGSQADELRENVELLEGAANPFELSHYLKGNQTPVFFGSAINWMTCDDRKRLKEFEEDNRDSLASDADGHLTFLSASEWCLEYYMEKWPEVSFYKTLERS